MFVLTLDKHSLPFYGHGPYVVVIAKLVVNKIYQHL